MLIQNNFLNDISISFINNNTNTSNGYLHTDAYDMTMRSQERPVWVFYDSTKKCKKPLNFLIIQCSGTQSQ